MARVRYDVTGWIGGGRRLGSPTYCGRIARCACRSRLGADADGDEGWSSGARARAAIGRVSHFVDNAAMMGFSGCPGARGSSMIGLGSPGEGGAGGGSRRGGSAGAGSPTGPFLRTGSRTGGPCSGSRMGGFTGSAGPGGGGSAGGMILPSRSICPGMTNLMLVLGFRCVWTPRKNFPPRARVVYGSSRHNRPRPRCTLLLKPLAHSSNPCLRAAASSS